MWTDLGLLVDELLEFYGCTGPAPAASDGSSSPASPMTSSAAATARSSLSHEGSPAPGSRAARPSRRRASGHRVLRV